MFYSPLFKLIYLKYFNFYYIVKYKKKKGIQLKTNAKKCVYTNKRDNKIKFDHEQLILESFKRQIVNNKLNFTHTQV